MTSCGRAIALWMIANSSELRRAIASSSRSEDRSRLATPRSSLSPEKQHRDLFRAAAGLRQHLVQSLAQRIAVRQSGQPVMMGHEGEPRLRPLSLGDVHQRHQHRGLVAIRQLARIDRQIDQRAVGLDVLPGSRGPLVAGLIAGPGQLGFERLEMTDRQHLKVGPGIAVVPDRRVVDTENALTVQRADDHRHRIAVEQQPERGLALLQFGDVDAQADDAAVAGQPLLDQDAAAIGEDLLMALAGVIKLREPLGDPFLFATDRCGIIAALDADPDRILKSCARLEQVGTAVVDLRLFLVPENVAPLGIEKHDALGQNVDRLAQPLMGFSRMRDRGFGLGSLAHDLAHRGDLAAAFQKFRIGFYGAAKRPDAFDRGRLRTFRCSWQNLRHWRLICVLRPLSNKLSEKTVSFGRDGAASTRSRQSMYTDLPF
jgi:hypothetical protein